VVTAVQVATGNSGDSRVSGGSASVVVVTVLRVVTVITVGTVLAVAPVVREACFKRLVKLKMVWDLTLTLKTPKNLAVAYQNLCKEISEFIT
jgi:hypothetical protein